MTVTIATAARTTPQSFRGLNTVSAQTTTTATSAAHGQALDPDIMMHVIAGGTETFLRNAYTIADSETPGQEMWITLASATGAAMVGFTGATAATQALIFNDAGDTVQLKWINEAWNIPYQLGATLGTASSPT